VGEAVMRSPIEGQYLVPPPLNVLVGLLAEYARRFPEDTDVAEFWFEITPPHSIIMRHPR
jgi:hypothetical protein